MSVPTEFDFAIIKMGDGASPEVFATLCGVQDVTVNMVVNTRDESARDCAKPGETPVRKVKAVMRQCDITGTGLTNADQLDDFIAALGKVKNYKIEGYQEDGTDAGSLLGTFAGQFMMTAHNLSITRDGQATGEFTFANHGDWTWTAAGGS